MRAVPHTTTDADSAALAAYALALGDDALVFAQRLGEWITNAPQLEEDVALGNIALDQLGQARMLLTYAGEVEGRVTGQPRTEDDLAYLRDERAFTNVQLVELANGDFARTTARLLAVSTYQLALYAQLQHSTDPTLAAIAAKAVKEVAYHRDHAASWVVRLGDGTDESHRRMQSGLERIWPYTGELFDATWIDPALIERGVAVDVRALEQPWRAYLADVISEATLEVPEVAQRPTGGRRGIHTEAMGYLLAEMQHLTRSHPGATW